MLTVLGLAEPSRPAPCSGCICDIQDRGQQGCLHPGTAQEPGEEAAVFAGATQAEGQVRNVDRPGALRTQAVYELDRVK